MTERIVVSPHEENNSDNYPTLAPEPSNLQNVVDIDDYRKHLERIKTRQKIAEAALTFSHESKFLPMPLIIKKHENGDTTVILSESEEGFFGDVNATHKLQGWSGGLETERIIVVRHDKKSDTAVADYSHPRNRRFLRSDLRTQPLGYSSEELQFLSAELENQRASTHENR